MNEGTDKELMIFSLIVNIDLSKRHMVTFTWSQDYLTLYYDGDKEHEIPISDFM
jgi:hypothetical protein